MFDLVGNLGGMQLLEDFSFMSLIGGLGDIGKAIAGVCLLIGLIQCFAGFKVYKFMMGVFGFFFGAAIGAVVAVLCKIPDYSLLVAAVLGIIFAFLSYKLYLIGVFLMTFISSIFVLMVLVQNIYIAAIAAFVIALLAVFFVKPVIIVTTSLSGAELIVSAMGVLIGFYRLGFFIILALKLFFVVVGIVLQFLTNMKRKPAVPAQNNVPPQKKVFAEIPVDESKYPGMQRAYRNYCIKCGSRLSDFPDTCPNCGYSYDN